MDDSGTDSLPPVQYLIMETLAARYRLGEPFWTFPKRLRPALDALQERGLLWWQSAVTPGDLRAHLTDAGRGAATYESYQTPDGRKLAQLREDNRLLERNWSGDRAKLVEIRKLADGLGERNFVSVQRLLYAILDGTDG